MNDHRHLCSLRARNIYLNFQHCDCALHIVGVQDKNQPAYSCRLVSNREKMRKKWLKGPAFPCAWWCLGGTHQPVLLWPLALQLEEQSRGEWLTRVLGRACAGGTAGSGPEQQRWARPCAERGHRCRPGRAVGGNHLALLGNPA